MKVQIKPGFLFPTQFWTVELNENIEQLQNEAYLIRKNDKGGVRKSNAGYQGYHSKDIRDLNNLPGTNQLLKQIINAVNAIHQISRKGDLKLTNFWINISGKGSSNTPHTHSGLTYSGVFFIKVPKENMLVVFPAWVPHAVEINLSDEERISLSFNFKLNRTF